MSLRSCASNIDSIQPDGPTVSTQNTSQNIVKPRLGKVLLLVQSFNMSAEDRTGLVLKKDRLSFSNCG